MASIREQKLDLYKKLELQRAKDHLIIRYRGLPNAEANIQKELTRIWQDHTNKITSVPSGYTLAMLKSMVINND